VPAVNASWGGLSVQRPMPPPACWRARAYSGRIWTPRPISPVEKGFGALAPVTLVRGVTWQRWRVAVGAPPRADFRHSVQRPIASARARYPGRVLLPRGVAPDSLRAPLAGRVVASRLRWRPGKARTASALPPANPVSSARLAQPVAARRRLTPGQVIFPRVLVTPSPVLWRSVLKPIASPRRLTPGCASVPRRAPTPMVLGPPTTTALLAPVNPVRCKQRQRWRPAICGLGSVAAPALSSWGVRPIAVPRRVRPGRATFPRTLLMPSPVRWRSVLKPIASPRRLTPGCASVHRGAPPPALPAPPPTTALLAPVNPVRCKQRQRWRPAICALGSVAAPALSSRGVRPIAVARRVRPGWATFPRALIMPSPVRWRSVLKPIASPRRLAQGRASVPASATTSALLGSSDERAALLAPVNLVRRKQRQRWWPAIR
jgi:hypothetical protein